MHEIKKTLWAKTDNMINAMNDSGFSGSDIAIILGIQKKIFFKKLNGERVFTIIQKKKILALLKKKEATLFDEYTQTKLQFNL